jgi:hypothetical protein
MFESLTTQARCLALALCVGLPLNAWATPCAYRGLDADARVMNRSGEISTPFPIALSAHDCRRLRVATGTVDVFVAGPQNAIAKREVSRGSLVLPSEGASASDNAGAANILKQMVVVLEGVHRIKNGSSRGAEGDYLVANLPVGRLAQPVADLTIALGPTPDANFGSFELFSNGRLVHRQSGPTQIITLPVALLKPGANLQWKLVYSGSKFEGALLVEPAAMLAELQQSLLQEGSGSPESDALVDKLRVASRLSEQGYFWDARALIRAALVP